MFVPVVILHKAGYGVTYQQTDEFTTADPAPVVSPRTAEPGPGTLTFIQTHASMAISSGVLEIPVVNSAAAGDGSTSNVRGDAVTRTAGRMFLLDVRRDADNGSSWTHPVFGFFTAATPSNANNEASFGLLADTARVVSPGNPVIVIADYTVTTMHNYAIVLRATGSFFFIKISGIWTLLWVGDTGSTATLYPALIARSEIAGETSGVDNWRVPSTRWTPTPLASDSFDRTDSTTLGSTDGAGAAESGGNGIGWTETKSNSGEGEIVSNKLQNTGTGAGDDVLCDVAVSQSDIVMQVKLTPSDWAAAVVRANDSTPSDDHWEILLDAVGNSFEINEYVSGTPTTRASASVTITAGTEYAVQVVADGTTITAYLSGANRITYGSASTQQAATRHGVKLDNKVTTIFAEADDFVLWARDQTGFPSV